jgi:hypothetical protein
MSEGATNRFRMFIDESGSHSTKRLDLPANRYLCLLGLIFSKSEERDLKSSFVDFKLAHFGTVEVVLHRDDIVNGDGDFSFLKAVSAREIFDSDLLELADGLHFSAVCAIIDKVEHVRRYRVWKKEPYHYCLEILLERFVMHMNDLDGKGDIVIEARNPKLDAKLKKTFQYLYNYGTSDGSRPRMAASQIQKRMTSREIKIREKRANIAGLQLADIFANPACSAARLIRENCPISQSVGGQYAQILEWSKYRRSDAGVIDGWGRKWLP